MQVSNPGTRYFSIFFPAKFKCCLKRHNINEIEAVDGPFKSNAAITLPIHYTVLNLLKRHKIDEIEAGDGPFKSNVTTTQNSLPCSYTVRNSFTSSPVCPDGMMFCSIFDNVQQLKFTELDFFCQSRLRILPSAKINLQKWPKPFNFCQSGEISPNLVTLLLARSLF